MKHSNQTQPGLIFEIEEVIPAAERRTEEGCDLCRHCQLMRIFMQSRTAVGPGLTKIQREHFPQIENKE